MRWLWRQSMLFLRYRNKILTTLTIEKLALDHIEDLKDVIDRRTIISTFPNLIVGYRPSYRPIMNFIRP